MHVHLLIDVIVALYLTASVNHVKLKLT